MNLKEGSLEFDFRNTEFAVKFDETEFYRNYFNKLPGAKGVDFISLYADEMMFIEVKDCIGHESDNRWRISPDNRKVETASIVPEKDRESLDIEVTKKVAMTLSCLCGAYTKRQGCQKAQDLEKYSAFFDGNRISSGKKKIKIVLFLEGNFGSESLPESLIFKRLGDSIAKKMQWLECKVFVENLNKSKCDKYNVKRI